MGRRAVKSYPHAVDDDRTSSMDGRTPPAWIALSGLRHFGGNQSNDYLIVDVI
jgi:hypothetical protein